MIAFEISDIGPFIQQLLKGTLFDNFLLQEATITQAVTYNIDGTLTRDYYTEEELTAEGLDGCRYLPFARIKPICFDIMKGKRKPSFFKFVFLLSPENQAKTIARTGSSFQAQDITGMFLNIVYKNEKLVCTTGISYRFFSLDRSLEKEWDHYVALFFKQHDIAVD